MATPKKPCFADGGQLSKADQMIADINAKYGVSGKSTQAPTPAPAPSPSPSPPKEAPGSMLQKAAGLFSDRAKQIDKASGYRNGGKIEGPGTPTSDSIPATVAETGENIQVSNTERIISAKQEILLAKIAQMLGFESVDAMLEAGTGQPVGPTVKGGKRAASDGKTPDGMTPEEKAWRLSTGNIAGPYAPDFGKNVGNAIASVLPAESPLAQGLKSDTKAVETPTPDQKLTLPGAPQMSPDPNNAVPRLLSTAVETYPQNTPATYRPDAPAPKPEITAGMDSKQNYGTGPGAEANAVLERANKARAGLIESMIAANGGNGVAILPETGTQSTTQNMMSRFDELAEGAKRTGRKGQKVLDAYTGLVRQQMASEAEGQRAAGHDATLRRGQDISAANQSAGKELNPLDQRLKGLQIKDQEQMAALRGKVLDQNAPKADRDAAAATLRALSGKVEKEDPEFDGHVIAGGPGEGATFATWSRKTGQPVFAGTGADAIKAAQPPRRKISDEEIQATAKARGLTPAQVKQALGIQ